jgi:hypothetical protein
VSGLDKPTFCAVCSVMLPLPTGRTWTKGIPHLVVVAHIHLIPAVHCIIEPSAAEVIIHF